MSSLDCGNWPDCSLCACKDVTVESVSGVTTTATRTSMGLSVALGPTPTTALVCAIVAVVILAIYRFWIEPRKWRRRYEIKWHQEQIEVHSNQSVPTLGRVKVEACLVAFHTSHEASQLWASNVVHLDVSVEHISFYHQNCFLLFALFSASFRAVFSAKAFSSFLLRLVSTQLAEASSGRLGMGTIMRNGPAGISVALVPLVSNSFGIVSRPRSSTTTTGMGRPDSCAAALLFTSLPQTVILAHRLPPLPTTGERPTETGSCPSASGEPRGTTE